VPRARIELARQFDPTQDFKSCASTNFATGAYRSIRQVSLNSIINKIMIKQLFLDSTILFKHLIQTSLLALILTFLGCELLEHYFTILMKLSSEDQLMYLLSIVGQLSTALIEFLVLTLLVPLRVMEFESHTPPSSFWKFSKMHTKQLLVESIRALAVTLMWALLLVIPGIFKYLRFSFVSYVVVADPEYNIGNRDALEYSNELIKGFTIQIFLFLAVLFGLSMALDTLREKFPITQFPVQAVFIGACFFIINLYANVLLFRVYQMRVKKLSERTS
jgi:hypothetical protein